MPERSVPSATPSQRFTCSRLQLVKSYVIGKLHYSDGGVLCATESKSRSLLKLATPLKDKEQVKSGHLLCQAAENGCAEAAKLTDTPGVAELCDQLFQPSRGRTRDWTLSYSTQQHRLMSDELKIRGICAKLLVHARRDFGIFLTDITERT